MSSSSEPVDEEIQIDDQAQETLGGDIEMNPPKENKTRNNPALFEPLVNKGGNKYKSESSNSDNGSSDENIADPFSLL